MTRIERPGPGKGVAKQSPQAAQAPVQPLGLHLEQLPKRLADFQIHSFGQAAHIVMALDDRCRATHADALDDIWIQGALR